MSSPVSKPTGKHLPPIVPQYLTPKGAAVYTGISLQELERLRRVGGGPRFCRVSARLVRYSVDDLCAWLDSYKVNSISEAIEQARAARQGVGRE